MPKAVSPKAAAKKPVAKTKAPIAKSAAKPIRPRIPAQASKADVESDVAPTKGPGSRGRVDPSLPSFTPIVTEAFLHAVALTGNISVTCEEMKLNRLTVYQMKATNEEFAARLNEALEYGVNGWEDEAARRAFKGYDRPVYQQGMLVGKTREYSDTLATFLLKGARPEKHREKAFNEITMGTGSVLNTGALSDDELNAAINSKLVTLGSLGKANTNGGVSKTVLTKKNV